MKKSYILILLLVINDSRKKWSVLLIQGCQKFNFDLFWHVRNLFSMLQPKWLKFHLFFKEHSFMFLAFQFHSFSRDILLYSLLCSCLRSNFIHFPGDILSCFLLKIFLPLIEISSIFHETFVYISCCDILSIDWNFIYFLRKILIYFLLRYSFRRLKFHPFLKKEEESFNWFLLVDIPSKSIQMALLYTH